MPNRSSNLNFFTAIKYDADNESFINYFSEKVDDYFYLIGKKAYVLPRLSKDGRERVVLSDDHSSALIALARVISYLTIVIPCVMLIAKVALRSMHSFKVIDPKAKLEKGIDINEETIHKIQNLIPKIIQQDQEGDEIEWLSTGRNLVFKLKDTPELVFKMTAPNYHYAGAKLSTGGHEETNQRFENMIKAKAVCIANQLGLLIIPHAKKFAVNVDGYDYTLIAEEFLDVDPQNSAQEECYHKYSTDLNESVRQLAVFVGNTRFNDVIWRNIPVLNEPEDFHGPRRIVLIDLEHMESVINGFIGDVNGSLGLIQCVSEEQIDSVIEEARRLGLSIFEEDMQEAKERRLQQLESDRQLEQFYEKNNITGKEPIQVSDLESLGLDVNEENTQTFLKGIDTEGNFIHEEKTLTLKDVIEDVVDELNKCIQNNSDQNSLKGQRYILLDIHKPPFVVYNSMGLPHAKLFITEEEEEKQLWLRRIIQALVDKGHLFKLEKVNGHGYFIQA